MRRSTYAEAIIALLIFNPTIFAQQFFTNRATFLPNISPTRYDEAFSNWSEGEPLDGHQKIWEAPGGNGFNWDVTASGEGNQMLYSLYQAVSTSSHEDELVFTFTGDPVYAFGGDFWGTMFDGFPQATQITFETDTGQSFTLEVTGRSFLGIVSNVPLSSVTISTKSAPAAWSTAGNIITGGLNPAGDLDGDGMSNSSELAAGTDPANPNSNLRITSATVQNAKLIVTFSAVAGKTYCLEFAGTLDNANWQPVAVPCYAAQMTGPAQFTGISLPQQSRGFYRVRLATP